jgi:hypothetical protein
MQRMLPVLLFFLVIFGGGVLLGLQAAPGQDPIAWGLGVSALLPVLLAYLVADRRMAPRDY